jgi:hypothetical protein
MLAASTADFIERSMIAPIFTAIPDKVPKDKEAEEVDALHVEGNVVLARSRGMSVVQYTIDCSLLEHSYPHLSDVAQHCHRDCVLIELHEVLHILDGLAEELQDGQLVDEVESIELSVCRYLSRVHATSFLGSNPCIKYTYNKYMEFQQPWMRWKCKM